MRSGKNVWAKEENYDMDDSTRIRIAIMYNNTLRIIIFGLLSLLFNHWWVILISGLFLVTEKGDKND
jgi:hypothetical protein